MMVAAAGQPPTNPKNGPKSRVAENPVKYSPGQLDWDDWSSTGKPSTAWTLVEDASQIRDVREACPVPGGVDDAVDNQPVAARQSHLDLAVSRTIEHFDH